MANTSSPHGSSPISLTRSTSLSARKTYSKRASVIREKRKAEALIAEETDDSDQEGDDIIIGKINSKHENMHGSRDGSPISKRAKDDHTAGEKNGSSGRNSSSTGRPRGRHLTSSKSLPSSPPPPSISRTPSPSPPPIKKSKSFHTTPSYPKSIIPPKPSSEKRSAPIVELHPPSSSPPLPPDAPVPSTPPRRTRSVSKKLTPHASPSSYEELFSAVSPRKDYFDSPGKPISPDTATTSTELKARIGRPGGLRRMLSKTQSMSAVPITTSPLKDNRVNEDDENIEQTSFGKSLDISSAHSQVSPLPTTPSKKLQRTQSMPESPSSRSSPKNQEGITTNLTVNPVSGSGNGEGSGGRAKRTYGGKRSMLAEVSQVNLDLANVSKEDVGADETAPEASYAELRKKYETDNDETENGSGNLMAELLLARAPQTVSDMRSKGENRRFMDELSCLIDGIVDPSMGMSFKRSSAIDILRNMQDDSWLAKMSVCGQVDAVWESLIEGKGEEPDQIMETICMLFLATLLQSDLGVEAVVQNYTKEILDLLLRNLKIRDGPLDPGIKGKGNNATQKLRNIYFSLMKNLSIDTVTSGTRLLASSILNSICQSKLLSSNSFVDSASLILENALDALILEAKILGDRFDLYEKGLDLLPAENPPDFNHIYPLLQTISRIAGTYEDCASQLAFNHKQSVEIFVSIIMATSALILNETKEIPANLPRCVLQTLQLLIIITNISSDWTVALIKIHGASTNLARLLLQRSHFLPPQVQDMDDNQDESQQTEIVTPMEFSDQPNVRLLDQDFVCTILALLIQCVRSGKETAHTIATTKIDTTCKGKWESLRRCHDLNALPFTYHLCTIYSNYSNDDDNIYAKAITGYLALVITKLLASTDELHLEDIKALPAQMDREKLEGLRGSLRGLKYEVHQSIKQLLINNSTTPQLTLAEEEMEDDADESEMESIQEALDDLEKMIKRLI
ncbi:uncharacterized protein L201_004133 [Kwoniella dendrophila CBS 6074]|uniref:Wings apart-like protein C-terminal domain-containing protein n=1 Tax=Kwoniella dendrophila CBS 6074 TaxID=1295534 RepID=A0AAX4JUV4_9TREE